MNRAHTGIVATLLALILCGLSNAASLVARWDFDQPSPLTTTNGNPTYDLTEGGNVTFAPSPLGTAAVFHGGTFPITSPSTFSNPALDRLDTSLVTNAAFAAGFSVMGWVRYESQNPDGSYILSHDSDSLSLTQDRGFGAAVYSSLELNVHDESGNGLVAFTTGAPLQSSQWMHVAMTWDGSTSDGFAFYVNGILLPHTVNAIGPFAGLNGTDSIPVRLGAHLGNASSNVAAFDGSIDRLSLYSGVLTPGEIAADFAASAPAPSPAKCGVMLVGLLALLRAMAVTARRARRNPRIA